MSLLLTAACCSWVRRFFVADFSAVILPYCDIEPLLSSTSATRSFELFQYTLPVVVSGICENPTRLMKLVLTEADPFTVTPKRLVSCAYVAATCTFVASGR